MMYGVLLFSMTNPYLSGTLYTQIDLWLGGVFYGCASSMSTFGHGSTCGHSTGYDGIVYRSLTCQVQLSSHYPLFRKIFFLKGLHTY